MARFGPFLLWLGLLIGAWSLLWVGHEAAAARFGLRFTRDLDTVLWTLAKVGLWLLPVAALIRREGGPPLPAYLGLDHLRGVGIAAVASLVWIAVNTPPPARAAPFDLALASALLVAPLFEEVVFRGWALHHLCRRGVHFLMANLATALAFALLHVPGWVAAGMSAEVALRQGGGVVALGLGLGFLRRGRSLWGPILLHLTNNLLSEGLIGAALDAATGP